MLSSLKSQGIPNSFLNLLKEMYKGLRARVKTDVEGQYFKIKRGGGTGRPFIADTI